MPSNDYREVKIRDLGPPYDTDLHASCKARLRDEQARTDAEQATARQAWIVVDEIRGKRDYWRGCCWIIGVAFVVAVVIAIVK